MVAGVGLPMKRSTFTFRYFIIGREIVVRVSMVVDSVSIFGDSIGDSSRDRYSVVDTISDLLSRDRCSVVDTVSDWKFSWFPTIVNI